MVFPLPVVYNTELMEVITRYPPSPTGEIHIGNMRTMLFNYLWAKKHKGQVVLRFEDTDSERSDMKYEQVAIQAFQTLGIEPDRGPFRQSERKDLYRTRLQELINQDLAYEGEESSDGSGQAVIRFRNPNKEVSFIDLVRGEITIDTTDFGDFIIARSLNDPLYHFTVVVDDLAMGVTHILRGEDHITSTPRQLVLIEALGGQAPTYAHLPLIVGDDKKKLSKRHGAVTVGGFMDQGYLPSALVNYLAFLGWNPGDDREIFSLEELIEEFSLDKVNKSPATFSYDKLDDINRQHLLMQEADYVAEQIVSFLPPDVREQFVSHPTKAEKIMQMVILERMSKFGDVTNMALSGEFACFFTRPSINSELVSFKDESMSQGQAWVAEVISRISHLDGSAWERDTIKNVLWEWLGEVGRGSVLHPMRTVLSGRASSPDPFTIAEILGKEETLERLQAFVNQV